MNADEHHQQTLEQEEQELEGMAPGVSVHGVFMSKEIDKIASALAKAQGVMEAAKKGSINPHFKSNYADLSECIDAVREPLSKNGLAVVQLPGSEDSKVALTFMLTHSSGQYIGGHATLLPDRSGGAHGFGSTLTYLRRYTLAAITGLAQADDDGNAAQGKPPAPESGKNALDVGPAKKKLEAAAKKGTDALKKAWEKLEKIEQHTIANGEAEYWNKLKSQAADVDAAAEEG